MNAGETAALGYAARGWPVFPLHTPTTYGTKTGPGRAKCSCGDQSCQNQGKHPRVGRGGLHQASTDPATITRWWRRWPTANLGVRTGIAFDVLDLDGPEALDEIDRASGRARPLEGPMVLTGRGVHIYVAATGNTNRTKMLPGVDWRGAGGYVVAPPSMHYSGVPYQWSALFGEDTPVSPAPAWLAHLVVQDNNGASTPGGAGRPAHTNVGTNYGRRALEAQLGRLALATEGERNDLLYRAALALGNLVAGSQLDATEVAGSLLTVAGRIGLGETEALRTIESGMRSGMQRPRRPEAAR